MDRKETRKTVRTLGFASFFNDLGSDMIFPIWPLFLTSVLGANMAIVGFIDGLGDALVSLSQAFSGYLSDRLQKRKIFVWIGYALAVLARVGYAVSTTWHHVIPFKMLDRTGKIRGAPRDAIIADISTRGDRGTHFGFVRMMDNLGAVCGIIICIILFHYIDYRTIFLIAAVPSAVATGLIFFFLKEKKWTERISGGFSLRMVDKNFTLLLVLSSLFALGSFSYSFLLIWAHKFGFRLTFVPVLYLIFTAVASLCSLPFGKLSDRIGRKPVLMLAFFVWAAVCATVLFAHGTTAVITVFILYGLHRGIIETVQKTYVSEVCPAEFRASSLGTFQMVTGLCALPASVIAGVLWEGIGIMAPFYFSFCLTAVSTVLLLFVRES